jgi:DNA-binding transcriptional regulator LsrR (DeoR family)
LIYNTVEKEGIVMPGSQRTKDDRIVYGVCSRFLRGDSADDVAKWVQNERKGNFNRTQVYQLMRQAIQEGYLLLNPPYNAELTARVNKRYPNAGDVIVVNARGEPAVIDVAYAATDLILDLIDQILKEEEGDEAGGKRKRKPGTQKRKRRKSTAGNGAKKQKIIRIGFGSGSTIQRVAQYLALRLQAREELPRLGIHAISSGFSLKKPETAPLAFFSFFAAIAPPDTFEYVGLFAPGMVEAKDYDKIRHLPGVNEAFDEAEKIDIAVISLARMGDPHSRINKFLGMGWETQRKELRKQGWVGDVLWHPYSKRGPIEVKEGLRALSPFDIRKLCQWKEKENKHIILVAAPCRICEKPKTPALRPLLTQRSLRVANHIVTDVSTAEALVPEI